MNKELGQNLKYTLDKAPVVEVILGIQFRPIAALNSYQLARFCNSIASEFDSATIEDVSPLELQYEKFGDDRQLGDIRTFGVPISQGTHPRYRIANQKRSRMIQIQNGRFHYNWMKKDEEYPHYETVRAKFDQLFSKFQSFVRDQRIGIIEGDQWEITYVDLMPKGLMWTKVSEIPRLFKGGLLIPADELSMEPDALTAKVNFEIVPKKGRVYVDVQHAYSLENGGKVEVIRMDTTARGPIINGEDGLNVGHSAVSKIFKELMSAEAFKTWGCSYVS